MAKVVWQEVVLAESENVVRLEGNLYFPPDAINRQYFRESQNHTVCPWKGVASYYDIEVDGQVRKSGAWYYPDPSPAAQQIKDYVAFYGGGGVQIIRSSSETTSESGSILKRLTNSLFG